MSRLTHGRTRRALFALFALFGIALAGTVTATPAMADDDQAPQRVSSQYAGGTNVPILQSDNIEHVGAFPGTLGISGCFAKTGPFFYVSGLDSVTVYNTRDPLNPKMVGKLDNLVFENEAMNCGERVVNGKTKRFVLIGVDTHQASSDDINHVNALAYELIVIDVTNPSAPQIRGRVEATTSTHTVACVDPRNCRYAYSAGSSSDGTFSVIDLKNLNKPRELDSNPTTEAIDPFPSPTAGHKWNFDNAGYGTNTGFDGSAIFNVRRPAQPRLVTTTGRAGRGDHAKYPGYNDFIHHNSERPRASRFEAGAAPSFKNGNVMLITEEDYEQTDCSKAGSFQTWKVNKLDRRFQSAITPLDKVELSDLGNFPSPQGGFCSAHWFQWHQSGIVAVAYYGGGLQLIDARNPRDLTSYGHVIWGASEVWDAYWVPFYKSGVATQRYTNVLYTVDLVRGLDVYAVQTPGDIGEVTKPIASTAGVSRPYDLVAALLLLVGLGSSVVLRRRVAVRANR